MAKSYSNLVLQYLGRRSYVDIYARMYKYSYTRNKTSSDQLWVLEHEPVYTIGRHPVANTLLPPTTCTIPVVCTDRGGQLSYHGPGQAILYTLIDLKRLGIGIRPYVRILEEATISFLASYSISAHRIKGAPGVYVSRKKIASLGLSTHNGCCYHGIALNVDMDLTPFNDITPCGLTDIPMTQLADCLQPSVDTISAGHELAQVLTEKLTSTCHTNYH